MVYWFMASFIALNGSKQGEKVKQTLKKKLEREKQKNKIMRTFDVDDDGGDGNGEE